MTSHHQDEHMSSNACSSARTFLVVARFGESTLTMTMGVGNADPLSLCVEAHNRGGFFFFLGGGGEEKGGGEASTTMTSSFIHHSGRKPRERKSKHHHTCRRKKGKMLGREEERGCVAGWLGWAASIGFAGCLWLCSHWRGGAQQSRTNRLD